MLNALGLLKERRFLPLFVTQFLGAFNDNLFKQAMVIVVVYQIYDSPSFEQSFTALATGLGILPFFLFSALAGQLADAHDKTRIIRIVKTAEIIIMALGAVGLFIARYGNPQLGIALMLSVVVMLGLHSTFFGPIKYAILPQHLHEDEVLGGTGLVESATYIAILAGTVAAGFISLQAAAVLGIAVAGIGWFAARQVPSAPREGPQLKINFNPFTSSWRLVNGTMHVPRLFLAILAISFFWTMGAVLIAIFTPLTKNVLTADKHVATLLTALFSIGIAIGSVAINSMLKGAYLGEIRARLGDGDGRVRRRLLALVPHLARGTTGAALRLDPVHRDAARHPDHRGARRHRGDRRDVRGAALRVPHDDREQGPDCAHRGREQRRQFGRDGVRRCRRVRAVARAARAARKHAARRRGDVPGLGVARLQAASRLRLIRRARLQRMKV